MSAVYNTVIPTWLMVILAKPSVLYGICNAKSLSTSTYLQ